MAALAAAAALPVPLSAEAVTIDVTTTADSTANDDKCSLREAITATNTDSTVNGPDDCKHDGLSGKDVIELPGGIGAFFASGASGEDGNASGDLDVEAGAGLTIRGEGTGNTHVQGSLDRVFQLESGPLTLRSLEVTGGNAGANSGGGVLVTEGDLTLKRATVSESGAAAGGGIALLNSPSSLTISRATISGNAATGPGAFSGGGGGILFDGDAADIDRMTLSGNSSTNGEGGGLLVSDQEGKFTMKNSSIVANHANTRSAGGLDYTPPSGTMTVSRSLFSQNTARFAGGGIDVGNDADILKLKSSAVSNNSLSSTLNEIIGGGGITNGGVTRMKGSIVAANTLASPNGMASLDGAGVRNDNGLDMTIASSLITNNTSPDDFGGGIYSAQPLQVSNTTISANGVGGTGDGAGLFATVDPVVLSHVTFAENVAADNGDAIVDASAGVTLHASVVANGPDACDSPILSTGFNLDEASSCGFGSTGDLSGTPAKLKPLADNGGPPIGLPGLSTSTLTYALKKSSQAVDFVPKSECEDAAGKRLRKDQRGVKRPFHKKCDSGAYELSH